MGENQNCVITVKKNLEHFKEQHVFSCGLIKLKHGPVRCLHGFIAALQLESCKTEKYISEPVSRREGQNFDLNYDHILGPCEVLKQRNIDISL